jgi:hypothetical protein
MSMLGGGGAAAAASELRRLIRNEQKKQTPDIDIVNMVLKRAGEIIEEGNSGWY